MMLKVQRYDLIVVYKPGKLMYIADTLSRAALPVEGKEDIDVLDEDIICEVNMLKSYLPVSESKLNLLREKTSSDECLGILKMYISKGWPQKPEVSNMVLPFWSIKHDLHVVDDLVFKNQSIVVPSSLHKMMLESLHCGHVGKQTCEIRARNLLYWPTLHKDIESFVNKCSVCAKFKPMNAKEPLLFHDVPDLPWHKVSGDIFEFDNQYFLVLMDYYSKYIELVSLSDITSKTVIEKCKSIFARHGIPVTLVVDSGSQFTSNAFHEFSVLYDFKLVIVSPKHSQSNGQAESGVKIAKNLLKKTKESKSDVYLALLSYRNTSKQYQPSPAELMFSRKLNGLLPLSKSSLQPKVTKPNKILSDKRKDCIKKYYDRNSKELPSLNVGDKVYFKKTVDSPWTAGKVVEKNRIPRSYVLSDEKDKMFVRNRKMIRPDLSNDTGNETIMPETSPKSDSQISLSGTNGNSLISPQSSPVLFQRPVGLTPRISSEEQIVKSFDGCVSRKGRLIRNPKRLSYD
ncbi:uncharacterized protein K02A2.6-like isoform X1 [Macrosteles quadrilineatus]|uniref:uncharacterized protein K02A2.6-like isoform X1 n=1 Tax=Macrosteles quadrilineatus TaxID=74068 RepID=UPI0023E34622|nr:uncharacterized protein K02A2.6-like isoform X1 [Macrosteles quadrilineatus]